MPNFTNCRPDIVRAHARALWCMTWANYMENTGQSGKLSGQEITEIAPPTKEPYLKEAEENIVTIERDNGKDICDLLADTWQADPTSHLEGDKIDGYVYDFGFFLAMQVLGSGVRWSGDHGELPFTLPYRDESEPYGGPTITEEDFEAALLSVAGYDLSSEADTAHDRNGQVKGSLDPELQTLVFGEIRKYFQAELFNHPEVKEGTCIVCLEDVYRKLEDYGGGFVPPVGGLPWVRHVLTDKVQEEVVFRYADRP